MKKYLFAALIAAVCLSVTACTASSGTASKTDENQDPQVSAEDGEVPAGDPAEDTAEESGTDETAPEDTVPEDTETEAENTETIPEDIETEPADPDKAWKDTYAAALWIYASGEQYTPECRFSLACIDADDIPELLIHQGADHACGVEIYAYLDGGLINVSTEDTPDAFGADGSLLYAEKGSRIASNYRAMGEHTCDMYTLDASRAAVLTRSYYDNEDSADGAPVYRIDGADVSAEDYYAAFDTDNAGLTLAGYENAYEFTSENYVALF